jgi:hypothetical protein
MYLVLGSLEDVLHQTRVLGSNTEESLRDPKDQSTGKFHGSGRPLPPPRPAGVKTKVCSRTVTSKKEEKNCLISLTTLSGSFAAYPKE